MKTAKEIREKCYEDIRRLQEQCEHKESEWVLNEVRVGCYIGELKVCKVCEQVIDRKLPEVGKPLAG